MKQEFPSYFKKFACVGGSCPDSCCIGWEVDIDEDSYYYYQTLEGTYGDLIRSRIRISPEGDYYFPMTRGQRCPFLDEHNLCDLYIQEGEASLCQTCTEYPRYFNRIGDYEQVDLSLSCMEAGRLFFAEEGPITWESAQLKEEEPIFAEEPRETEDWPEKKEDLPEENEDWPEETEDLPEENEDWPEETEDLPEENEDWLEETQVWQEEAEEADEALRDRLIGERNRRIGILQGTEGTLGDRLKRIFPEAAEEPRELLALYEEISPIDHRWTDCLRRIRADLPTILERRAECLEKNRDQLEDWFTRLAVYFTYRYTLDAYYDGDLEPAGRLTLRSLEMILLMTVERWLQHPDGILRVEDMIDLVHLYSKEVEHCEENVTMIKGMGAV